MAQPITIIAKNFINLLYPLHCAACKIPLDPVNKVILCPACEGKLKKNPKPYCEKCGRSVRSGVKVCGECERSGFAFERAWSAYLYEDVIKELIWLFKFRGKLSLSSLLCGKTIKFIKDNREIIEGIDTVTFVPAHHGWLNDREYNQSAILASAVSREFKIPLSRPLEKTALTKRQNELARDERLTNLMGMFKVNLPDGAKDSAVIRNARILLIDDVMTTGATLNECSKTLKNAGAKEVRCLTLARGM